MRERGELTFREAVEEDLPRLVALLADDPFGRERESPEDPLPTCYRDAFRALASDPNNAILLACEDRRIVGMLQLTYTPSITHRGGWRATVEGVRTAPEARGRGVGSALMEWALDRAREKGCRLAQLTTDRRRPGARAFYERLGFRATHDGMKLPLETP